MKRLEKEVFEKLQKEKRDVYLSFMKGKITLEQLKEKLSLINEIEKLASESNAEIILLDKREIRELSGKTLYISLPREIEEYGWSKGLNVKIFIEKKGKRIILERF